MLTSDWRNLYKLSDGSFQALAATTGIDSKSFLKKGVCLYLPCVVCFLSAFAFFECFSQYGEILNKSYTVGQQEFGTTRPLTFNKSMIPRMWTKDLIQARQKLACVYSYQRLLNYLTVVHLNKISSFVLCSFSWKKFRIWCCINKLMN